MPSVDYNGLFSAVSRTGQVIARVQALQGSYAPTWLRAVAASYGSPPSVADGTGRALASFQAASARLSRALADQAADGLVAALDGAVGLPSLDVTSALAALSAAMIADGQSVQRSRASLGWSPGVAGLGLVAMAGGAVDRSGVPCESSLPESIALSYASPGVLLATSPRSVPDRLDPSYPGGSGLSSRLAVVAADSAPGSRGGQMLANGELDYFAGGLPASWRLLPGQTTRNLSQAALDYSGYGALQVSGDGTELTGIAQIFGADTPVALPASTALGFCLFARIDSIPASGTLEVRLVDPSRNVLGGMMGPCQARFDLTRGLGLWGYQKWGSGGWGRGDGGGAWGVSAWGLRAWGAAIGSPFVPLAGAFATPAVVPPGSRIEVRLSSPLPPGATLQVDRVAMAPLAQLYPGGPSIALFSGPDPVLPGYSAALRVSNDFGGGMQWLFDVLFGGRGGPPLPSSDYPTIAGPGTLGALPSPRPGGAGVGSGGGASGAGSGGGGSGGLSPAPGPGPSPGGGMP